MAHSVGKNLIYYLLYEIPVLLIPFLVSPYVTRVVGSEGIGLYSYSHTIAGYFMIAAMLGLGNHGNRSIAAVRRSQARLNETFSSLLVLHLLVSVPALMGYMAYVSVWSEHQEYGVIQILSVLSALFDISWFYFGIEQFKLIAWVNTIIKVLSMACVFTLVRVSDDLWKYCLIMAGGTLAGQLILWIPLGRYVRFVRPNWKMLRGHIKPLVILFLPVIAVSLYKQMDKIMLGAISGMAELGFYENGEKVSSMPIVLIGAVGTVMLPRMSFLAGSAHNEAQALRYITVSMKGIMWLIFALAFGLAGIADSFSVLYWGEGFQRSGAVILGLSITLPFLAFANVIRTQYLIPNQRDRVYVHSVFWGAVTNFIINCLVIPRLGAVGATIGTIAAEVAVCLVVAFSVRKELPVSACLRECMIFLLIGIAMFLPVRWIGRAFEKSIVTLLLQILCGVCVYCGLSVISFLLTKDRIFLQIVKSVALGKKVKTEGSVLTVEDV